MELKDCTPVLFVKNAKSARDFYQNVLGLKVTMDFGGLNFVFGNGFAVWQMADDDTIPHILGADNITNSNLTSRFELNFETEDLDGLYRKLKENGTRFLHEINTEIYGQRNIRFYDPDGHLIEIGESTPVFLSRIYEEENHDLEATSKCTYIPVKDLKKILNLS